MDKLSEILIKLGLFSPMSVLPLLAAAKAAPMVAKGLKGAKGAKGIKGAKGKGGILSTLGAGITSGAKFIKGMQQKKKAKGINDDRINKTMNKEVLANTASALNAVHGQDAAAENAKANVQRNLANTAEKVKQAGSSSADVISAITASGQLAGQTLGDIATDASVIKDSRRGNLAAARTAQSRERDAVHADKVAARDERVAEKKSLLDAAAANKMEGAKGMFAAGAKALGGDKGEAVGSGPQEISKKAQKNNSKLNVDKTKMAKGKQVKGLKKPAFGGFPKI